MRFLSVAECTDWAAKGKVQLSADARPHRPSDLSLPVLRFGLPAPAYRTTWFAGYLSVVLPGPVETLLWVTDWGIWPSSENWHLYDHVRRSYGDSASLPDAPGHLFAPNEAPDLATFLQLGMLFGWDMSVLMHPDRARLFVSHDEYVEVASADTGLLDCCRAELATGGIAVLDEASA